MKREPVGTLPGEKCNALMLSLVSFICLVVNESVINLF